MVGKIFLNYRRADSEAWADRLYERLKSRMPDAEIFMDIDGNIPLGRPWAKWLDSQVAACDLMLVLIGRSWVAEFDARSAVGQRDFVRVEIESALEREIPVVPVFLSDAPVPQVDQLPKTIRPLLDLQATRLQRLTFESDAIALIDGVVRSIKLMPSRAIETARPKAVKPTSRDSATEGRIKVDGKFIHGAPDSCFLPGNGKSEWFKDLDGGPEMVVVPAGSFMMGSPNSEERYVGYDGDEAPFHSVSITEPFAVGRHAISRGQFGTFVNHAGYKIDDGAFVWSGSEWIAESNLSWRATGFSQDDGHPVVCVSWHDAMAYVRWLSRQTGKQYRLLTEAEWEYVARAGTTTPFWWGKSISTSQANYDGNFAYGRSSKGKWRRRTVSIDRFDANRWGLFNVHGNVWEWCEDTWHGNYTNAPPDGSVWLRDGESNRRLVRGGSWLLDPVNLRSATRASSTTDSRNYSIGFRIGRTLAC